ncbi:MAG: dihydroorotate dehydrogenase-like protein [Pirellulales bacterium]
MSVNLSTEYLGLKLQHPLMASASPLSGTADGLRALEQAGASAAVLPSLFEEQIQHDEAELNRLYEHQAESFAESLSYFPEGQDYRSAPDDYLSNLEEAKKSVSIPLIGSLNGCSLGGWTRYAKSMQNAGADALELNIYYVPTDPNVTGEEVEKRYAELVASVRESVTIPMAVKFGTNFSSIPNFAKRLVDSGANGLVMFNRWLEPDIDLEELKITPSLVLSNEYVMRVPLRWIAILREHLTVSMAATSGVHRFEAAAKLLLVGADVVMMASVLLQQGAEVLGQMRDQLSVWMDQNEYASVSQMKGSMSRANCPQPSELARGNYMKALVSYTAPTD